MKLSTRTLGILKAFSQINNSIVVNKGNKLATMAVARNILAEADIEESFDQEFAIYNLTEFLAAVSLFQNPTLTFSEKWVVIGEEGARRGGVKYFFSNKALIVHPTKSVVMPPEIDAEFVLKEDTFKRIQKAAGVLGVNDLIVVGDEEGIAVVVKDKKNDSSNDFEVQVSDVKQSDNFKHYFRQDNLKLIPTDYKVRISSKGIASFTSEDGTVRYAIALESN